MFVEVMDKFGGPPIRLECSQLVIRGDGGTPLCVAGEYGPSRVVRVAHADDPDFNQTLRAFGYGGATPIVIEHVSLNDSRPTPPGARLFNPGGAPVRRAARAADVVRG